MELIINKENQGSTIFLWLGGILDISTNHVMNDHLEVVNGKIDLLVLDFTNLEFIDSTGIGSIINAIYLAQEKKFKLEFKGMNELTNEIFETVGLYRILETLQAEVA